MFSIKKKFNSLNNYPWMYYRKSLRRIKNYSIYPIINFVVIGSAKCGTTSLHKYLNFHPDIYMPSGVGINDETGLFLVNKDQKIKSLGNRKIRQNLSDEMLYEKILGKYHGESFIGEETTDYTKKPYRTTRFDYIKSHNPEMKFVFIIRDPVEKIFSQYRHFLRYQKQSTIMSLKEELLSFDYYQYASAYYYQLDPYIRNFGKDSIHVLLLEDMSIDANKELNKIFSFLNAKPFMMQQADLPKYKVNTMIEKNNDVNEIPLSVRDYIIQDVENLQKFLGYDPTPKWPLFNSILGK